MSASGSAVSVVSVKCQVLKWPSHQAHIRTFYVAQETSVDGTTVPANMLSKGDGKKTTRKQLGDTRYRSTYASQSTYVRARIIPGTRYLVKGGGVWVFNW